MQGKNFLSTSEEGFSTEKVVIDTCPPAAGSARDHFSDADYNTKDVCDEHRQTVSVNVSFLVKDTVPS